MCHSFQDSRLIKNIYKGDLVTHNFVFQKNNLDKENMSHFHMFIYLVDDKFTLDLGHFTPFLKNIVASFKVIILLQSICLFFFFRIVVICSNHKRLNRRLVIEITINSVSSDSFLRLSLFILIKSLRKMQLHHFYSP